MKWLCLIAAWIAGIVAASVLFVGLTAGSIELLVLYSILRHPHDPTPGAGMGWLEIVLAPIVLPIVGSLSLGGGIIAGAFLNSKMQPGRKNQIRPTTF